MLPVRKKVKFVHCVVTEINYKSHKKKQLPIEKIKKTIHQNKK